MNEFKNLQVTKIDNNLVAFTAVLVVDALNSCFLCISIGKFDVVGCRENFHADEVDIIHCKTQCLVSKIWVLVFFKKRDGDIWRRHLLSYTLNSFDITR